MTNNYIIFDMDGVLLDSEPMHQEIIYETFQLKGIPFDKAYIQTLTGMSAFPMWEKVKRDAQRTESVEENEGKHLSLASSSGRKLIDIFTQQTNIAHYFEVIMSGDDVQYSKPNPEIFLKVAQWYHLPATQFTVIEDSTNGVKAAKSANMQCIGFQNPLSGGQDLSQADLLIHSMQELL